jgi:crossover junction endodeoxyribonuclease RuvC
MIIGIDIGTRGALALLTPEAELVEIADMPVLRDSPKGPPTINAPLLSELIYRAGRKWTP